MDILTLLSSILFSQQVFIIFFAALVFAALFIVYSYVKNPAKQDTTTDEAVRLRLEYGERIKGLQEKNTELEKAAQALKGQAEAQAKDSSAKLSAQLKDRENQAVSLQKELSAAKDKLASFAAMGPLQEELKKKDEVLKNELAVKEKQAQELKEAQKKILELTSQKEELNKQLQNKPAVQPQAEKSGEEAKGKDDLLPNLQAELKSSQEVYQGLKEQYAELERVVDSLNQSLALEKTLHQRLKEEHSNCSKPLFSNNPSVPPQKQ